VVELGHEIAVGGAGGVEFVFSRPGEQMNVRIAPPTAARAETDEMN